MWFIIAIPLLSFLAGIVSGTYLIIKQNNTPLPDNILNEALVTWVNNERIHVFRQDFYLAITHLFWSGLFISCLTSLTFVVLNYPSRFVFIGTVLSLPFGYMSGGFFTMLLLLGFIAPPRRIALLKRGYVLSDGVFPWKRYSHFEIDYERQEIGLFNKSCPSIRFGLLSFTNQKSFQKAHSILGRFVPSQPPNHTKWKKSIVYLLMHLGYAMPTIVFLLIGLYWQQAGAWALISLAALFSIIGFIGMAQKVEGDYPAQPFDAPETNKTDNPLPNLPEGQDPILDKKERKWLLSREKMITYIVLISLFFILPFLLNRYVPEWEAWEFIYEIVSQLLPFLIPVLLVALGVTPFWERRLDNLIKSGIYEEALHILDQKRKYLREADYLVKRVQLQMWLGAYDKALLTAVYYIKNNQRNMEFVKRLQKDSQAPLINTHTFRPLAEVYMAIQEWEKAEAIVNYALSNTITTLNTPKLKTIHPHILAAQGKPFTKPTPPKVTRWGRFARWQNISNQNEENKLVVMLHAMHALSYSDTPEQALPFIEAGEKLVQKDNVPEYAQWLTAVAHAYQANNDQSNYNQTLAELKRIDRTGHFQRALPQPKQ